jgi:hypothetical protein
MQSLRRRHGLGIPSADQRGMLRERDGERAVGREEQPAQVEDREAGCLSGLPVMDCPARPQEGGARPRGQALAGVACRRRQKRYESPQSTPVAAAQPHASGPSPTEMCAMRADTRSMANPA